MKRLLGSLALLLVPALLAVPNGPSASGDSRSQVLVSQAVTASDLSARTRRIFLAVRGGSWDEVASLADDDVVAWFRQIDDTIARTTGLSEFPCRRSVASRPGDPVFACRATFGSSDLAVGHVWWIYHRQVAGRWTAVNRRLESSLTAYRTGQNLGARTTKIYALAWAEDWSAVEKYATPRLVNHLKFHFAELKAGGAIAPPTVKNCDRTRLKWRYRLGQYFCTYPIPTDDEPWVVRYDRVDDRWLATLDVQPFTP